MAKTSTKTATQSTNGEDERRNVPALATVAGLPAEIADMMEQDAGKGGSQKAEDNLIPLIYILQDMSPQVKKRDPAYIEGAEPGDFWFRGTNRVVKGSEGMVVQSCAFNKDVVEWIPRDQGGGIVTRHAVDSATDVEGARLVTDPKNPKRKKAITEDENELRETRYHYVLEANSPYCFPFSGSGHSDSRNWMQQMNAQKTPRGNVAPHFGQKWRLRTRTRENAIGSWFAIDPQFEGFVTDPNEYARGKALYEAVMGGEVRAADIDQHGDEGAAESRAEQHI
jgi:hypothetical protein